MPFHTNNLRILSRTQSLDHNVVVYIPIKGQSTNTHANVTFLFSFHPIRLNNYLLNLFIQVVSILFMTEKHVSMTRTRNSHPILNVLFMHRVP